MKHTSESLIKRVNKRGAEYFKKWRKVAANSYILGLLDEMPSDTELLSKILEHTYEELKKRSMDNGSPWRFAFPIDKGEE